MSGTATQASQNLPVTVDQSAEDIESIANNLATELVARLLPLKDILQRYSLSTQQYRKLLGEPWFQQRVVEARRNWNSDKNTRDRIRTKAQLLVEEGLVTTYGIFKDVNTNPTARLDAMKLLSDLAHVGTKSHTQQVGSGSGLVVEINIGDPEKSVCIGEDTRKSSSSRSIIEGESVGDD